MKPLVFVALLIAWLFPPVASAAVHDVFAHSSPHQIWVATVDNTKTATGESMEQTSILVRQSGPGRQWNPLMTLPARISRMASRASSLVVVLNNGDWMSIWGPTSGSTGTPLPAHGSIRALSDDGDSLWAVGSVRGGLAMTTRPATTEAATEPVENEAASDRTTPPSAHHKLPPKLVLFQQQSGSWVPLAELPADVFIPPTGDISLAIVAGRPLIAFELTDGALRTIRFDAKNAWEDVGLIAPEPGHAVSAFHLVNTGAAAVLWASDGKGAGRLYLDAEALRPAVDLKWVGGHEPDSIPAVTYAGGYLRVIGLSDHKLYEQRYEANGTPVGSAAQIDVPVEISNSVLEYWLNGALIFALAFSAGAMIYRRSMMNRGGIEIKSPAPAPFVPRLNAGVIDALPLIVVFVFFSIHGDDSRDLMTRLFQWSSLLAGGIAIVVYLLHTTLTELFTGRSVGKWIFGLKVVSLDGSKPTAMQLVLRNVLRVIDLLWFPLVLVFVSPLRQRTADLLAGTMVILADEKQQRPNPDGSNDSNAPRGS